MMLCLTKEIINRIKSTDNVWFFRFTIISKYISSAFHIFCPVRDGSTVDYKKCRYFFLRQSLLIMFSITNHSYHRHHHHRHQRVVVRRRRHRGRCCCYCWSINCHWLHTVVTTCVLHVFVFDFISFSSFHGIRSRLSPIVLSCGYYLSFNIN